MQLNQDEERASEENMGEEPAQVSNQDAPPPKQPRRVNLTTAIFWALLLSVAVFITTFTAMSTRSDAALNSQKEVFAPYSKLDTLLQYIRENYVRDYSDQELWDGIYSGLFSAVGDPYTTYMTSEQFEAYRSDHSGQYVGIGVNVVYDPLTASMYIYRVTPDSPAQEAGLQAGDRVTAVGSLQIGLTTYTEAVNSVAGEAGTEVTLTLLRGETTFEKTLTRRAVKSQNVLYEQLDGKIAYITIVTFSDSSVTEQFRAALEQAKADGCVSYLFDVRNNPGGNLDVICNVLDLLLPEGPIVNIVSADGSTVTRNSGAQQFTSERMAVLCNGSTASAAELFVADLRDYKLAKIVGDTTYGKGTVQTITSLSDGSAIRLTTSYYTPASGSSYDGEGIHPDISVSLSSEQASRFYMLTHEEDPQLQAAIGYLTANN